MSKVYSVEVLICATAYIRADSAAEAAQIANENFRENTDASLDGSFFGDVEVSGARFDFEGLPDVSLSPAMTFLGRAGTGDAGWTADDVWEVDEGEE